MGVLQCKQPVNSTTTPTTLKMHTKEEAKDNSLAVQCAPYYTATSPPHSNAVNTIIVSSIKSKMHVNNPRPLFNLLV